MGRVAREIEYNKNTKKNTTKIPKKKNAAAKAIK